MDNEKLYLKIINSLCDGVYFVDEEQRITFWNKAAENITGYTADEMIGRLCSDNLLCHIDEEGRHLCIVGCPLFATIVDGVQRRAKVFLRHKNGHRISAAVNVFPMMDKEKCVGAIEIFTPFCKSIHDDDLVERLSDSAMKDALTELPNRRHLESFLEYKLNKFNRFGRIFAVLFADIDNFTLFNNKYGHNVGDAILKNISKSISQQLRQSDLFGRWGGEEFIGIYDVCNVSDACIVAEKVRVLIESTQVITPYGQLSATASIGITLVRRGDTIESIVKRSDELMYKSKQNGKNRIHYG